MKKILIILINLLLIFSCIEYETKDVAGKNRVFKTENNFYVYYNGKYIEIPKGTYIANDKKIENYYIKKIVNKSELLNDLNKFFPDSIEYVTKGEKPKESIKIPTISADGKVYIDSVKLEKLLAELPRRAQTATGEKAEPGKEGTGEQPVNLEGKKIEILNANGLDGYASGLGEALKAKFKVEFNAENYEKEENFSYVVNNKLSEKEVIEILDSLSLKYIKKLKPGELKPNADFVIITGKDENTGFKVQIFSSGEAADLTGKLKAYSPVLTKGDKYKETDLKKLEGIQVIYNPEDYYTAYKIAQILKTDKLTEDAGLKNSVVVLTKN